MVLGERAKTDSMLLLSVGLITGFILSAVVFFTVFNHTAVGSSLRETAPVKLAAKHSAKTTSTAVVSTRSADTVPNAAAASSIEFAPSSSPVRPATTVPEPITSSAAPAPSPFSYLILQREATAVAAEPDAQNTELNIAVSTSGSGTELTTIDSDSPANPNWAMDRNGLIGNPCVDPPSTNGRAYSSAAN